MSRLNYAIQYDSLQSSVPGLRIQAINNYVGTPKGRIYKQGDSPPAFSNMVFSSVFGFYIHEVASYVEGTYIYEFQDDNGSVTLGKINVVLDFSSSCYPECGDNTGDIAVSVTDSFVTVVYQIDVLITPILKSVSIDDAITFKAIPSGSTHWSNFELESIGIANVIPFVKTSRQSNGCTETIAMDILLDAVIVPTLNAHVNPVNETVATADDGKLIVEITSGSGSYQVTWGDATTTILSGSGTQVAIKSNLPAGDYTISVLDLITSQALALNATITEPQVVPPTITGSLLIVPFMNCIHFVVDPIIPNDTDLMQGLDNVLFCDQVHEGFLKSHYTQKKIKNEIYPIQFYSDYPTNIVQMWDAVSGEFVKNYPVTLKEENIGKTSDFNISIRNHVSHPGQSRVYFSLGALQVPLNIGDSFEILDNTDGFNGVYTIVGIETDSSLGVQYLVINVNYGAVDPSSSGTGRFNTSTANFNVYEAYPEFSDIADGEYYMKITAFATEDNFKIAQSEPIEIAVTHPGTHLIEYNNVDKNVYGLTWTTGYIGRLRIPSNWGIKRLPGGEVSTSRNSDYSLVNNSSRATRGTLFETIMLPPWLHEKVSVVFKLDNSSINKVDVKTTEQYAEPKYIDWFVLANSSIKTEQTKWFDSYNSDDIGTVADGGFLLTETGFLKL